MASIVSDSAKQLFRNFYLRELAILGQFSVYAPEGGMNTKKLDEFINKYKTFDDFINEKVEAMVKSYNDNAEAILELFKEGKDEDDETLEEKEGLLTELAKTFIPASMSSSHLDDSSKSVERLEELVTLHINIHHDKYLL